MGNTICEQTSFSENIISDVCQLRLDFDNFVLAGPSVSDESAATFASWTSCQDTWTTTVTIYF